MTTEIINCQNCEALNKRIQDLSLIALSLQNQINNSDVIRCKDCNKWKTTDCMVLLLVGRAYFMNPTNQNHPPENFYCAYRIPKSK